MFVRFLVLVTAYIVYVEPNAAKDYGYCSEYGPYSKVNVYQLIITNIIKAKGTFNLNITRFEVCKGPKQKDCAIASATINNSATINYEISVFQNVSPTKGKIVAMTNGKEFLRLQVKKPCDHLFLRPLFSTLMNVTKDCYIIKGHYKFNVDILAIAESYFGGSFVFGTWTFRALFYNDVCNFSCTNIQVVMSPKQDK